MHQIKVILLAIILAPLCVMAEQIEVPNEFVDATPAEASQVNQNFTAMADESNSQDVRIQSVESAIAGPEKMVFLGYAEGHTSLAIYANNQICKDAYSNPAARWVTTEAWQTLIDEGQVPLPATPGGVRLTDAVYVSRSSGGTIVHAPTIGTMNFPLPCFIWSDGNIRCQNILIELTACMAPAG
jgi:hypothetical protein